MTTTTGQDAPASVPTAGGEPRAVHPNLALAVIAVAQLMVVLDATIVNIALPSIQGSLHFSTTGLSWVLNAYTLVFGGLLLLGGRTGDLFGRRRMFIIGVLLFAAASLLGGFAPDKGFLLAMRALQGVGGAIASPTALSLVTTTFPEGPERNRAFGVYAAVSGAGAALGLLLGGILTDLLSWRFVLFVNAPIGIALAFAAPRFIAESQRRSARSLDLPGAITSTVGMAALVYGFIHAASDGWSDVTTIVAFVAAVVLLAVFVAIEARTTHPLMPLRMFDNRTRVGSYVIMLVTGAAVFAMFYFLTLFVQEVKGYSPLKSGVAFLPVSAVIIVVAQVVSRFIQKIGPQVIIITGALFAGFGLLLMSYLHADSSYIGEILPSIGLVAIGMGMIFVPITLTAVAGVRESDTGVASAMLNVCQQVGGTIGLSALVTVFGTSSSNEAAALAHRYGSAAAVKAHADVIRVLSFTHGADNAFKAGALFVVIALVAGFTLLRVRPGETPTEPPAGGMG